MPETGYFAMPKVLVVDQSKVIGAFIRNRLKVIGVESTHATNPDTARFLLSSNKYDAIIIDPVFTKRLGFSLDVDKGIELIAHINSSHKNVPIIVHTAVTRLADDFAQSGARIESYIIKSYDESELIMLVIKHLGLKMVAENRPRPPRNSLVKLFISYAKEDLPKAYTVYEILKQEGYSPWIDEEEILPGQDWNLQIEKAIDQSNFFLACISSNSVTKEGYVQKELKKGLDILDQKPEGAIYVIPIRLESCQVPMNLKKLHWCNFFEANGPEKLLSAIGRACDERGIISD